MFNLGISVFKKTYVGIYLHPPYCYTIGITIQKDFSFKLAFKDKVLFKDFYPQRFFIYLGSIPLSLVEFDIVQHPATPKNLSFYLGLKEGTPTWMHSMMNKTHLQEYFLRSGVGKLPIQVLEIDVIAIWYYAYWQLKTINAYNKVILWMYRHQHGIYLLLGRNEMLWQMYDLNAVELLENWIHDLTFPKPELITTLNFYLANKIGDIPVLHFMTESEHWLIAYALAIRGAYAAI